MGAGLQLAVGGDDPGPAGPPSKDGQPRGALVEWVARPGAVGDVDVGPPRLDDDEGQRLLPLRDGEVRGRAHGVGELAQDRPRLAADDRGHRGGETAHPEPHPHPAVRLTGDEAVLLERADEAVDHGSSHAEGRRQLGDRQSGDVLALGEQLEQPQAPVEGAGGLGPGPPLRLRHGPQPSLCGCARRPAAAPLAHESA